MNKRISDVLEELQAIQNEHGDVEVFIYTKAIGNTQIFCHRRPTVTLSTLKGDQDGSDAYMPEGFVEIY